MKNKLILLTIALICLATNVFAQITSPKSVPGGMLFQALAKDNQNVAATNREVFAIVTILRGDSTGPVEYAEKFQVLSGDDGIFTLIIGQGLYFDGARTNIFDIDWSTTKYFLNIKIAVKPSAGSQLSATWTPDANYNNIGTSQLWTVPYTFYSNKAAQAEGALKLLNTLPSEMGGTGVANPVGKKITLDKNLTVKGAGDFTIITTGASNITFPTIGTMATLDGVEVFTNKTLASPVLSGIPTTTTAALSDSSKQIANTDFVKSFVTSVKSDVLSTTSLELDQKENLANKTKNITTDSSSDLKYPTAKAVKAFVDSSIIVNATPDATKLVKGKILLSGDLTGIATSPMVNSVGGVSSSTISLLPTQIATNTASITAEITRATNAENGLNTKIESNTTSITAEITRATNAETTLNNKILSNTNSITSNTTAINAEVVRATSVEGSLDTSIKSNTASITANQTAIAEETSRAITTEGILRSNIATNTADILTKESLSNKLSRIDAGTLTSTSEVLYPNVKAVTEYVTNAISVLTGTISVSLSSGLEAKEEVANKSNNILNDQLSDVKYPSVRATKTYVDNSILSNATPDATSIVKGKIQLTGDLGGSASLPIVNSIGGVSSSTISLLPSQIASNSASITTNTADILTKESLSNKLTRIDAGTLSSTNDDLYPNVKAVTEYVSNAIATLSGTFSVSLSGGLETKEEVANKSMNIDNDQFSDVKYPSVKATKTYVDNSIISNATPDATSLIKGKIQLTGDLGGAASLPIVNSVGGVSSNTISLLPTQVSSNTSSITTNTADITTLNSKVSSNTASITANETAIAAETSRATGKEDELRSSIASNTSSITTNTADITTLNSKVSSNTASITANETAIAAETSRATGKEDELRSSIASNTSSITTNTADITTLNSKVSSNTASITANETAIAAETSRATGKEDELRSSIASNTSSITTNTADITTLNSKVSSNTASITANETAIAAETSRATGKEDELRSSIASNTSSITTNTADITTLNSKVSSNTASITANETAIAAETSRATGKEDELRSSIASNTSSITTNTADITTLNSKVSSNTASITANETAIAAETSRATGKEDELRSSIASNTSSITTNTADITTLNSKVSSNTASITANETAIAAETSRATGKEDELRSSIASNTSSITTNTADITTLNSKVSSNTASITANETAIAAETSRATGKEDELRSSIASNTSSITTNTADITTLNSKVSSNTASITANETAIAAETSRATGKEDELRSSIASNTSSITTNTADITTLNSKVSSNTASITANETAIAAETSRATGKEDELRSSIASNTSSITTNTADITTLNSKVSSNTASITANETAIAAETSRATGKEDELRSSIASNTSSITTNTADITTLNSKVSSNTASITANETAIAAETSRATGKEDELRSSIASNTSSITTNTADITTLNSKVSSNTASITANETAIAAETSRATGKEDELRSSIASNTSSITTNTADITTLNSKVSSNTASITANETAIAAETSRATGKEDELRSSIASNTSSITTNTADITTLNSKVSSNTASITANETAIAAETSRATGKEDELRSSIASNTSSITTNTADITTLNSKVSSNTASITAEIARAKAAELLKLNIGDTASMLSNYAIRKVTEIALNSKAPLISPVFTGIPTAPTPLVLGDKLQITNKEYVDTTVNSAKGALLDQINKTSLEALNQKEDKINKVSSITSNGNESDMKYPSVKAVIDYVGVTVGGSVTPEATTTEFGKIKLAGDLGGTASLPLVLTVGGSSAARINSAEVLANAASELNTPNTLVKRDATGNFTANTITASLTGNATSASILKDSRTISLSGDVNYTSESFDGSKNITGISTISNNAITYAKMQNVAAKRLLGNNSLTSSGIPKEIELGDGITFDANGNLSATGTGGTVTSISPITLTSEGSTYSSTVTNASTTPVIGINIPYASTTVSGLLNKVDFESFNNKQSALTFSDGLTNTAGVVKVNPTQNITNLSNLTSNGLIKTQGSNGTLTMAVAGIDYQAPITLTTIGTTGSATFSGTTLNIPQYTVASLGAVEKNRDIVGGTKTLITYDTKGLVTAGADATTADIAPSSNRNYVTDLQAGVLSNTSGKNTGDETTETIKSKLGITTLSGSNTGDQSINMVGDVVANASTGTLTTTISAGAIITEKVANNAITYAKMQKVTGARLLGNAGAISGDATEIQLGTGIAFVNGTLSATGTGGTVTSLSPITITASGNTFTSSVINASSTPAISITLPLSSVIGTTAGLISNVDYAKFASKQDLLIKGSGIDLTSNTISVSGITTANISNTAGITKNQLADKSIQLGSTSIDLGATTNTISGLASVTATNFIGELSGNATNVTGVVLGANGGTGVNNNGKTITLGGNVSTAGSLSTIGAYSLSLTTSGNTSITLPTTGTLSTLDGIETLTNKSASTPAAGDNSTKIATTAFVNTAISAVNSNTSSLLSAKQDIITEVADEFTGSLSQTSFNLTKTPGSRSKVKMYINGVRISNTAYSLSGSTITYTPASNGSYNIQVGDRIQFDYFY